MATVNTLTAQDILVAVEMKIISISEARKALGFAEEQENE